MESRLRGWLVVGVLLATAAYVLAEEISLTTYYPSPKGAYQTLSSTSTSHFATYEGGVGIGTADPGTAKLAVMNGNVGIGTTSPAQFNGGPAKLHIAHDSHVWGLIESTNAGYASAAIRFRTGAPKEYLVGMQTTGVDGSAPDGTFTISDVTANASRLAISSDGNVGIGTPSPGTVLDVVGTKIRARNGVLEAGSNAAADTGRVVQIYHDGTVGIIKSTQYPNAGWSPLTFQTSDLERMRIDTNGNVGIGTTSPVVKLTIPGVDSQIFLGAAIDPGWGIPALAIGRGNDLTPEGALYDYGGHTELSSNAYVDGFGAYRYRATDKAVKLRLRPGNLGDFAISTAPTGTGGDPITWTDRMIVTNTGDITIDTLKGSSGSGDAYVCVHDDGTLFRSTSVCR